MSTIQMILQHLSNYCMQYQTSVECSGSYTSFLTLEGYNQPAFNIITLHTVDVQPIINYIEQFLLTDLIYNYSICCNDGLYTIKVTDTTGSTIFVTNKSTFNKDLYQIYNGIYIPTLNSQVAECLSDIKDTALEPVALYRLYQICLYNNLSQLDAVNARKISDTDTYSFNSERNRVYFENNGYEPEFFEFLTAFFQPFQQNPLLNPASLMWDSAQFCWLTADGIPLSNTQVGSGW